jgi:hypothetical protein
MMSFKQLLESELLNDETKTSLQEAIETFKEEAINEARNSLEVEYAQKLLSEKEDLTKKMFALINESVTEEIEELKEDIKYYKDIEPKYAQKLNEFKEEYSKKLSESFETLVESQVKTEMVELKEDLMEAKSNNFGMKLYESFKETFEKLGVTEDAQAIKTQLDSVTVALSESKEQIAKMERKDVMESLLSNLSGKKREIMKTILENVDSNKLEDRYNETIDSVLGESSDNKAEDKEVLKESKDKKESKDSVDLERLRTLIGK